MRCLSSQVENKMYASSTKVKQVAPVLEQNDITSNSEWLASLLPQVKMGFTEGSYEAGGSCVFRTGLSNIDRTQIIESLLSNTQLKEVCTSPLSIASLLRHTSITSLLVQEIGNGLDFPLETSADTLPAIAEISFLINICNESIYDIFLHPVYGYATLLRQRRSVQRKLESLAAYARACCSTTNTMLHTLSYRLNITLAYIEQKYFHSRSL